MMWSLLWVFQNICNYAEILEIPRWFLTDNDSTKLYECKPITIDISLGYKEESWLDDNYK